MLSLVDLNSGRVSYYAKLARQDYYLHGGEPLGKWLGGGCPALGLHGDVREEDYRLLFHGFGPDGRKLVQNAGQEGHFAGVDLCWSCPKTYSAAWAVADPELRRRMQERAQNAVKTAVAYLEDEVAKSRTGKGGVDRESVELVGAMFEHSSSRTFLDPQLHYHFSLFNVGVSKVDGKTRALACEEFYRHKMAAGAVFRAELAKSAQELGFTVYRPVEDKGLFKEVKSWWEIHGVPQSLAEGWSKRSQEIAREVEARGHYGAVGKQMATLATRSAKETAPRKELFERWREEGKEHGLTPGVVRNVLLGNHHERNPDQELREAVAAALRSLTDRHSHFSRRQLVEQLAVEAQGRGLGYAEIMKGVNETLENSREVVRLGRRRGEARFTTREVLATEARLLAQVEASRGKAAHMLSDESVELAVAAASKRLVAKQAPGSEVTGLSDEQVRAVRHLCQGQDSVAVVTGWAGTGKTVMQQAVREAFEREGFRVLGCALGKKAALTLEEEAGIKSTSVAKLLYDLDLGAIDEAKHHLRQLGRAALGKKTYPYEPLRIDARTVVMVDEAAMVGTRQMQRLTEKVLERGGKVCLVGDAKQLQPVEAGGPFRAIAGVVGEVELTNIVRQKEAWHREAVKDFAVGRAKEGLEAFASRGQLSVARSRNDAMDRLIADWREAGGTADPAKCLIVCATNEERSALNLRAQLAMREEGRLSEKSVTVRGSAFHEGDRVVFTRNNKSLGVQNGSTGRIVRIGSKQVTLTTFHGKQFRSASSMLKYAEKVAQDKAVRLTVKLDSGKLVEVDPSRYDHLRLSYCLNTHHAQGQTVEKALLLTGGAMTSRELVYVQASRSRGETWLYTDRYSAGEGLGQLARAASKSLAKDLAHDLMRERPREAERGL